MHMRDIDDRVRPDRVRARWHPDAIGAPSKRVCTVGRALPTRGDQDRRSATGQVVPPGEQGELWTRGYKRDARLLGQDEATRDAIDAAGWMHTGDLAIMDDEGYCNIVGRIKDMIIRGGENVYPREIEEFLYTHPEVQDVQVIGVPDEKYGEEVMAWVKLQAGPDRDRRGHPRLLPRQDRALQDPALREVRRHLPNDRHRQGPEVQDARGEREGARPGARRRREDGVTGVRATMRPARGELWERRRDARRLLIVRAGRAAVYGRWFDGGEVEEWPARVFAARFHPALDNADYRAALPERRRRLVDDQRDLLTGRTVLELGVPHRWADGRHPSVHKADHDHRGQPARRRGPGPPARHPHTDRAGRSPP